jgi:hypothetical protein
MTAVSLANGLTETSNWGEQEDAWELLESRDSAKRSHGCGQRVGAGPELKGDGICKMGTAGRF